MKTTFLFIAIFLSGAVIGQSRLRDSLYGGKLKADTNQTFVSTDTSKYMIQKNETISAVPGDNKKTEIAKLDDSMPDSLNKLYYSKQRLWKRFIETNTQIVSQSANDSRKVKKGEYNVDIDYEIGLNGRVTTNSISCNPPNEFIQAQVTEFMQRPPVLSPPIYKDGKPRALASTQSLSIIKK